MKNRYEYKVVLRSDFAESGGDVKKIEDYLNKMSKDNYELFYHAQHGMNWIYCFRKLINDSHFIQPSQ